MVITVISGRAHNVKLLSTSRDATPYLLPWKTKVGSHRILTAPGDCHLWGFMLCAVYVVFLVHVVQH